MPVYNGATWLVEAIESALALNGIVADILVVDDGSEDDSAAIAQSFADRGVRLFQQPNQGVSMACNSGLRETQGRFVIFLDSDDILLPDAWLHHSAAFEANPDLVFTYGAKEIIDPEGRVLDLQADTPMRITAHEFSVSTRPTTTHSMFRREAIIEAALYDKSIRYTQDLDLNIRLMAIGEGFAHGKLVAQYRVHPGQATKNMGTLVRYELAMLSRYIGPGGLHDDPATLRTFLWTPSRYFGPLLVAATLRALRRRDIRGAWNELSVFLSILPASALGFGAFFRRRWSR